MVSDDLARAVHESGHAVAASAFGVRLARADIRHGEGVTICYYASQNTQCWPVVGMAGKAAGDLFGLPTYGAQGDREQVIAAVGRQGARAAYEAAMGLLECQRPAIEHLAEQLIEHGGLVWSR